MTDLMRLLRPKQWTKNLIALMPVIFSGHVHEPQLLAKALACVAAFCLVSSSVYILNDLLDREQDRVHPTKKDRPLASGRVKASHAAALALLLGVSGLALSFVVRPSLALVVAAYIALMTCYSFVLKNIALLDVFTIAAGFVLRAIGGAVAVSVPSSGWFLLCTSFGALFLALEKRRQEVRLLKDDAGAHRKTLGVYTKELLDRMEGVILPSLVTCYAFYSFLSYHGQSMLLTMPFVVYGLMRYQILSERGLLTGSPEDILLKDRPIQLTILLWLATCAGVVYGSIPEAVQWLINSCDKLQIGRM